MPDPPRARKADTAPAPAKPAQRKVLVRRFVDNGAVDLEAAEPMPDRGAQPPPLGDLGTILDVTVRAHENDAVRLR